MKCKALRKWHILKGKDGIVMLEEEGIDSITVHPRTRNQRYQGLSKWEIIKNIVDYSALRNTFLRFSVVPEDLELTTIDVDIFSSLVV